MPASFADAMERAQAHHAAEWQSMPPAARTAAIFHELCRMDSGCRRTGTAADADLPPCPASDDFIARRNCRLARR
jgi:hypothetical protein